MRDYASSDVTIVVTTVERPAFLHACIESLLRTTPPGVPLLVFFNGTTESTRCRVRPLLERWPGDVSVAGTDETVSIDISHQRALDRVRTRLVNFMGDDDIVLEQRLDLLVDRFNTVEPEPAVVTSWARRIAGPPFEPRVGSQKSLGPTSVAEWKAWRAQGRVFEMLWPGSILRTDLLRRVGFEADFRLSLDNRIFTQLAQVAPVLAVPHDGFGYRIHQGSISSARWREQQQHARFVERCALARQNRQCEPSFEMFMAEERDAPLFTRTRRELRSRSRRHFRTGGELMLDRSIVRGIAHLAMALLLWPPSFAEKLADQMPRSRPASGPEGQPCVERRLVQRDPLDVSA